MTNPSLHLNPFSFPLQGTHLIEASAGTGKTYTITSLYLRLLLGHGDLLTGFGRPLDVSDILLVTFTDAATQELKGRIRTRIHQAKRAFLMGSVKGDDFLAQLLKDFPKQSHPYLIQRLDMAEQQMDEAAIFTIHGFCQRMLKQNAFECGVLFDMNLVKDEKALKETASFDFWRETMYSLESEHMAVVSQYWASPQSFMAGISAMVEREGLEIYPLLPREETQKETCSDSEKLNTATMISQALDQWMETLKRFKQDWLIEREDIQEIIEQSDVSKRSYSKRNLPKWLVAVDDFCNDEKAYTLPEPLAKFSQSELSEKTSKGSEPRHPIFEKIERLHEEPLPLKELIQHAGIIDIRQRLKDLKKQQQVFGFSDLLTQLNDALHSDFGSELASRIRTLYPVSMIDEFQDTDLTQYGIFERIYFNSPNSAIYLIGDPKQAIYSFRNADIFTYMRAKQEVENHFHLDTNWRSTHAMVEATNCLFEFSKKPFIYDEAIPFLAVNSGGQADKAPLKNTGNEQSSAALQFFLLKSEKPVNKQTYQQYQAEFCADEIAYLLNAGVAGQAHIGGKFLASEDIAVLVRDRHEAALIQQQLQQRNVDAVYLSTKDGVFDSPEAADLYLLLIAISSLSIDAKQNTWGGQSSSVGDERAIRSALSSGLFLYKQSELEALFFDDSQWEGVLQEFGAYQELWVKQGVLPMLHLVFQRRQLMARLQCSDNAERVLTNILHLSELLQNAASELSGEKELLAWFLQQLESEEEATDETLLRLESDRKRVQIVTIHKSKGLEYPIVFIPFACSYKTAKVALYQDQTQHKKVLDLGGKKEALEKAELERLAEDLRLLYVALTRSVYRCYLGIADVSVGNRKGSDLHKTALGSLLVKGEGKQLDTQLSELEKNSPHIHVRTLDPEEDRAPQVFTPLNPENRELQARRFTGSIERNWRVSSFTALTRRVGHKTLGLNDPLRSEKMDLDALQDDGGATTQTASEIEERNVFTFPKGAQAGTLMHSLFENIDFACFDQAALETLTEDKLLLAGFENEWRDVLVELVCEVLQTPLNKPDEQDDVVSLNQITRQKRFVELEFTLPVGILKSHTLQKFEQQLQPESEYTALEFMPQRGYLKGFIDLIFEWKGQYFILDYKSNHLGDDVENYHPDKLAPVMAEHHYTLQYLLYSLALHRYLKHRIKDYNFQTHFGGVYYLFLRGMHKDKLGYGVYFNKPEFHTIEELDAAVLLDSGEEANV